MLEISSLLVYLRFAQPNMLIIKFIAGDLRLDQPMLWVRFIAKIFEVSSAHLEVKLIPRVFEVGSAYVRGKAHCESL